MEKKKLPISIVIRTINEEKNIVDCIKSCWENNPEEIIISDGGSTDKTLELARENGAKIVTTKKGLATQRESGVQTATFPYLAIIDADDRLKDDCLAILLKEMQEGKYDAIHAQHRNFYDWPGNKNLKKEKNYWEEAMDANLEIICSKFGPTTMVGRPALYKTAALKQITLDPIFKKASEDSDLSYRFYLKGLKQASGSGITYRKHLSNFKASIKKFFLSGTGEALFVFRHPEKLSATIKHELYIYPIKRSYLAISKGYIKYVPFFILNGLCRFVGFITTMTKIAFKKEPLLFP
ncbi:MAG: glycosyltransferase [Candidatus Staskawiczbacteria bacterium]|nr:glycosyltransferase [Candidatus Staskawiczbacteria bacterium]